MASRVGFFLGVLFLLISSQNRSLLAQVKLGSVAIGKQSTFSVTIKFPAAATFGSADIPNPGTAPPEFSHVSGGSCLVGLNYAAQATCTVSVTFAPAYAGMRGAVLAVDDNKGALLTTLYLRGTGIGPEAVFTPAASGYPCGGLNYPNGTAVDAGGNFYTGDSGYWDGVEFYVSPSVYIFNSSDGYCSQNLVDDNFGNPISVAADAAGNVYVADYGFNYQDPSGFPTTIAPGLYKEIPQSNGTYRRVAFGNIYAPVSVAVDLSGTVYVVDAYSDAVYKETPQPDGSYVQAPVASNFKALEAVAVDGNGNVFVADNGSKTLYRESSRGNGVYIRSVVHSGASIWQIAVDGTGNVYELDTDNRIYRNTLQSNGSYTRSAISTGFTFQAPFGLAVDAAGNLYVSDDADGTVQSYFADGYVTQINLNGPLTAHFSNTAKGSTSLSSPLAVTASNIGNTQLAFSAITFPPDFPQQPSTANQCLTTEPLTAGGVCALNINFVPIQPLAGKTSAAIAETLTLSTNSLNVSGTLESIQMTGTETVPVTAEPTFSLAPGIYTSTRKVALSDATAHAVLYYAVIGAHPTAGWLLYNAPIQIASTETIKALAVAPGYLRSPIASVTYTIATAPEVTTRPATALTTTSAIINGTVDANSAATQYWFAYGTSASTLTYHTGVTTGISGTRINAVTATLSGLKPKTTYYFETVASNAVGKDIGSLLTFTTK